MRNDAVCVFASTAAGASMRRGVHLHAIAEKDQAGAQSVSGSNASDFSG